MAAALQVIGGNEPGQGAAACPGRQVFLVAAKRVVSAVVVIALGKCLHPCACFRLVRAAGSHGDRGAHRVAGIKRGIGSVGDIHAFDLLRRHHAPARRVAEAVAEQVRQQHAVRVNQRACAQLGTGAARCHRAVAVADVAFAHQQARHIAQAVLDVDHVLLGEPFGINALDNRGQGGGEARAGTAHRHFRQRVFSGRPRSRGTQGAGDAPDQGHFLHGSSLNGKVVRQPSTRWRCNQSPSCRSPSMPECTSRRCVASNR